MTERLRNDKDRKLYVSNKENWAIAEEMPGVRIMSLEYGGETWYKLEVWQTHSAFDFKRTQPCEKTEWCQVRMYTMRHDTRAFGDRISESQIVERIKKIDKERKTK